MKSDSENEAHGEATDYYEETDYEKDVAARAAKLQLRTQYKRTVCFLL